MAGCITSTLKKIQVKTLLKRQPRVLFMCMSEHFDPELCLSEKEFIVNPNEEHVLLLINSGKIPTMIHNNAQRIWRKDRRPGKFLGYSICLKQPDLMVTVGLKTPLAMLLNSDYFNVVPFFVTRKQYLGLMNEHALLLRPKQ
jgi:hypothetical protein